MPEVAFAAYGTVRRTPGGAVDLCDLGPGDLTVGAGGSELLLHVDLSSSPERWRGNDWSVLHASSRHARLRIGSGRDLPRGRRGFLRGARAVAGPREHPGTGDEHADGRHDEEAPPPAAVVDGEAGERRTHGRTGRHRGPVPAHHLAAEALGNDSAQLLDGGRDRGRAEETRERDEHGEGGHADGHRGRRGRRGEPTEQPEDGEGPVPGAVDEAADE